VTPEVGPVSGVEDVVVVGGGPAGLAVAAELRRAGVTPLVLSESLRPGDTWRGHYDRLHLHTVRQLSHLPGERLARRHGPWVPKDGVGEYLDGYAGRFAPRLRAGTTVERIAPDPAGWRLAVPGGDVLARTVVVATGMNRRPYSPALPGAASFTGRVLHSSEYRTARDHAGERVLVVGTGNSGAEIAADLAEHGVAVTVAVRTAPTVLPRRVAGVPLQMLGALVERLPNAVADGVVAALCRLVTPDLTHRGLPRPRRGAISHAREDNVTITIDVGFLAGVRRGAIAVVDAVAQLRADAAVTSSGLTVPVGTVIWATGFRTGLADLLDVPGPVLDARGRPTGPHPLPGLWFHGYVNEPGGNLRHFRRRARPHVRGLLNELRSGAAAGDPGRRARA
jgi:cation diffusion facilitator CzcD-associated flavoprotein CzcO